MLISFRRMCLTAFILLSLLPSTSFAEDNYPEPPSEITVGLEAGPSIKILGSNDDQKKLIFSSIAKHAHFTFFNTVPYHELNFGGWMGKNGAAAFAYSVGLTASGVSLHLGPAYITDKNDSLGTHWQFLLGAKVTVDSLQVAFKHFSNGRRILGHTRGPNDGLNFITIGVAV